MITVPLSVLLTGNNHSPIVLSHLRRYDHDVLQGIDNVVDGKIESQDVY